MTPVSHPDSLPLHGLTILDLSQGIAGPSCCALLGQQGARVIKIEPPEGDWSRNMGRTREGQTAISLAYNAGKESVVLDLRTAPGRAALRQLAEAADLVVQSFRPGVAERLGVGYASLAAHQPRLVYVSISGYGTEGPLARLPAVDTTIQAEAGLMLRNSEDGTPRRIGLFLVDICAGLYAAQAASSQLYAAWRHHRGHHIEVSLLQTALALQASELLDDNLFGDTPAPALMAPTGLFATTDGHLYISLVNDAMFVRLATAVALPAWLEDPALRTAAGRRPRAAELRQTLGERIASQSSAYWAERLAAQDVLFGRVRPAKSLTSDAQIRASGVFSQLAQPALGDLSWVNSPGLNQPPRAPAPYLGEHTEAVLREFGLSTDPTHASG